MEKRRIIDHVKGIEDLFLKRVLSLKEFSCVGDVRAVGLIGAAEFIKPGTERTKLNPKNKFSARVVKAIQENGVILRSLPIDAIAFCPPLIIEKKELNEMFDRIQAVLSRMDDLAKTLT